VLLRFEQIIRGISSGFGCTAEFDVQKLTLPVINQPELAKAALAAVNKVVPGLHIETDFRSMVSEDMSFFMEKIPGVYLLVGSANLEEGKSFPHHHPRFDFDEKALTIGSSIISGVIVDQLIPGN
jgi:amidohydrolase